jgi:hypothetical protein
MKTLLLALLTVPAVAGAQVHLQLSVGELGPWRVTDCAGVPIELEQLPACVVFTSPKGAQLTITHRPGAIVAGISSGVRVVYAKSATGGRGKKLGELTVGTVARPIGYSCDPTDTITSGSTVYARITDPAVPESLRGYISGCTL